ncbi:MAG TPA: Rid family hydrolase [Reyranella sp.]|nr:Rid family hydrolase [Reyranella sp.]
MAKLAFRDGTEVVSFYARTVRNGPFVFVSGTTSLDMRGKVQGRNVAEQTVVTMRKVEAALKSAGASLKDLVRLTIFVTDIRDMGEISKALARVLKSNTVAATMVGVSALAVAGLMIEIEATAMMDD